MENHQPSQWETLLQESTAALHAFFSAETSDPQSIAKARVATSVLASYTRHEATESAREGTRLIIARQLAEDREQFAYYLRVSMPHLALPKPGEVQSSPADHS
mgnify:CR=1 FL=1